MARSRNPGVPSKAGSVHSFGQIREMTSGRGGMSVAWDLFGAGECGAQDPVASKRSRRHGLSDPLVHEDFGPKEQMGSHQKRDKVGLVCLFCPEKETYNSGVPLCETPKGFEPSKGVSSFLLVRGHRISLQKLQFGFH